MATAATISIQLEAQTATLKKGFDEAKQSIQTLDSHMSMSVAKGMAIFNGGLWHVKTASRYCQGWRDRGDGIVARNGQGGRHGGPARGHV